MGEGCIWVPSLSILGLWLDGPVAFRPMARHSLLWLGCRIGSRCLVHGNQERERREGVHGGDEETGGEGRRGKGRRREERTIYISQGHPHKQATRSEEAPLSSFCHLPRIHLEIHFCTLGSGKKSSHSASLMA